MVRTEKSAISGVGRGDKEERIPASDLEFTDKQATSGCCCQAARSAICDQETSHFEWHKLAQWLAAYLRRNTNFHHKYIRDEQRLFLSKIIWQISGSR